MKKELKEESVVKIVLPLNGGLVLRRKYCQQ